MLRILPMYGLQLDFSKCFSVRNNWYETLVEKKIAQLKPDIVDALALKCALYYKR